MEHTVNSSGQLNKATVGYMVNAMLSKSAQTQAERIQDSFAARFRDSAWITPKDTLHVTLLDLLAPLTDYSDDKDRLFGAKYQEYDATLKGILDTAKPLDLTFDRLIISPSAIAITADEQSTRIVNGMREQFIREIDLLPGTKRPPEIVHTTIIRFVGEIALKDVREIAKSLDFSFVEHISEFQLVRETVLPMLDYSVIKKYPLNG